MDVKDDRERFTRLLIPRDPAMTGAIALQERRGQCKGKGFTLAEILIALGILAIGMSMVAAIFPAAMEFNRRSTNSTLGTIICENGITLAELNLSAEIVDSVAQPDEIAVYMVDDNHAAHLTSADQHYPVGETASRTGFVMMARRVTLTDNIFQLVAVAYRKTNKNHTVELVPITCRVSGRNITNADHLRIGTPLISRGGDGFAFVDSVNRNGTAGTLDIDPARRSMPNGDYYVVVEARNGVAIPIDEMRRSPAIGAMVKVTSLRHDPEPDD
jgi:prepilin-type N-terminal cleavage/methylation domain-containing protein